MSRMRKTNTLRPTKKSIKRKSIKKPKEKPISWYIKQCDKHMSILVRSRGVCDGSDISSCGGGLQDAHVISRTNKSLRYDIMNHLSLCYKHHIFYAHKDPIGFTEWFKNKYPGRYSYLLKHRNTLSTNRTISDYKLILESIKSKNIKELIFFSID